MNVLDLIRSLSGETLGRTAEGFGQMADLANQGMYALANYPPTVMNYLTGTPPQPVAQQPPSMAAYARQQFGIVPQEQLQSSPARIGALLWQMLGPMLATGSIGTATREIGPQERTVTLYHGSPRPFTRFDPSRSTLTGLGGKGVYFFDDSQSAAAAYGKHLQSIEVPLSRLANLQELDRAIDPELRQTQNIDRLLQQRGFAGTYSPATGEYVIYDPNEFQ